MLLSPNLQNNTFLVRNSTRPNHYAISVRSDNRVLHLLIQHDVDEGMFFLKVDKKFPTIQRLVENYCHKTEDSYVFLLENTSKGMLDCDFPEYKVLNNTVSILMRQILNTNIH